MTSISIDAIRSIGVAEDCIRNTQSRYGSEVVSLRPEDYGAKLPWNLVVFLPRKLQKNRQIALASSWYNRAMAASTASWKTSALGLLSGCTAEEANAVVSARKAEMESAEADPINFEKLRESRCGFAVAGLALAYANGDSADSDLVLYHVRYARDAMCAQIAAIESKTRESVASDLDKSVLADIDANGIEL